MAFPYTGEFHPIVADNPWRDQDKGKHLVDVHGPQRLPAVVHNIEYVDHKSNARGIHKVGLDRSQTDFHLLFPLEYHVPAVL